MEQMVNDLRFGVRMLARKPGYTAIVVLTLALGIGAATAMFSIINGVLLRPLPYWEAGRLVRIHTLRTGRSFGGINPWEYLDIVEKTRSYQSVGTYEFTGINLFEGEGEPEHVSGVRMTPSVLETLGIRPALGRTLEPEDALAGSRGVALLSDRLWKRRFGADPAVLGKSLQILNDSYEIIGVMPEGFGFPEKNIDIWTDYELDRANLGNRGAHYLSIVARLRNGVTVERAQSELDILSRRLRQEFPHDYAEGSGFHFVAEPYLENVAGSVRPALWMLMGAVGFVLLIACANVANLLAARIMGREKEIAIRAALGAGAGRIVRQMLTEGCLFSLLGGLAALVLARGSIRALALLYPESLPRLDEVNLDATVLLFNLGLVLFTTVLVGGIPVLRISRLTMHEKLKDGGRESFAAGRQWSRAVLVVTEVALATVLLVGAGLLIRSFQKLLAVEPGFRAEQLLTTRLTLPSGRYPSPAAKGEFFRTLIEELDAQPGVVSAAAVNLLPMSGDRMDWFIYAEGYTPDNPNAGFIEYREVTPDYFKTMGIPLVRGRPFTNQDAAGGQPVAIISESLAKRSWGDQDPIGRRIRPGGEDSTHPWHTVVGVVGDVYHSGARNGEVPIWYRSIYQGFFSSVNLAVRTSGDPAEVVRLVKDAVGRIDPHLPIYNTKVMTEMVADSLHQERLNTHLLMAFATLALALAIIGTYGVISYSVSRRIREIGIRMALGAKAEQVLRRVLGEGLKLVLVGLVIGVAAALALTQLLKWLLFGVEAYDPPTFLGIGFVLLSAGVLACLVPALRAAKVDPIVTLRHE